MAIPILCRLVAASFFLTPEPLWISVPNNARQYIESSVCFLHNDMWRIAEPLVLKAALHYLRKQVGYDPLSQLVINTTSQLLELTRFKSAVILILFYFFMMIISNLDEAKKKVYPLST